MSKIFHLPSPANPALPLCGRVLSRNQPLTIRDHSTMRTGLPASSPLFAPTSIRPSKPCRHCQRAAGLLPPITRSSRDGEEENEHISLKDADFEEDE